MANQKPLITTMPVEAIGRPTDQNIRRLAIHIGDIGAQTDALQTQVSNLPTPLSAAEVQAIVQTNLASVGLRATSPSTSGPTASPGPGTTPPPTTPHADVVTTVKAALVAAGHSLTGDCGAFDISKHVAWKLNTVGGGTEDAGLLDKPSGANCMGYAAGIICYPSGQIFDILGDAGGANNPQWLDDGLVDPTRYRAPFDPGAPYP